MAGWRSPLDEGGRECPLITRTQHTRATRPHSHRRDPDGPRQLTWSGTHTHTPLPFSVVRLVTRNTTEEAGQSGLTVTGCAAGAPADLQGGRLNVTSGLDLGSSRGTAWVWLKQWPTSIVLAAEAYCRMWLNWAVSTLCRRSVRCDWSINDVLPRYDRLARRSAGCDRPCPHYDRLLRRNAVWLTDCPHYDRLLWLSAGCYWDND